MIEFIIEDDPIAGADQFKQVCLYEHLIEPRLGLISMMIPLQGQISLNRVAAINTSYSHA